MADWIGVLTQAHLQEIGYHDETAAFVGAVFFANGSREVFRARNLKTLRGIIRLLRIDDIALTCGSAEDHNALWAALHSGARTLQ